MSTTVELALLGPVVLRSGGTPVTGRAAHRKNVALLAYLALAGSRTATRERVIGVLWPEKTDQAARQSLRQALSDLRGELGAVVITTSAEDLSLDPAVVVDVDRAEACAAAGDLAGAAALVRGPFMAGFAVAGENAWNDWLESERHRRDALATGVLLTASDALLARGRLAEALETTHRALAISPRSAPLIRSAMKLHVLAGDSSRALEVHHRWQALLEEDGIEADPETDRLADEVRHGRRWRATRDPDAGAGAPRPFLSVREAALEQACGVWRAVLESGRAATLFIEGDLGSGRSRLADEVADRARLEAATVLDCRFVAQDADRREAVIHCLARCLPGAPGLAGAAPEDLAALAEHEPLLATVATAAAIPDGATALSRVLRLVADEAPLVLLLDDLGDAGAAAASQVQLLVRDLLRLPLLCIITDTPSSGDAILQQLRAEAAERAPGALITLGPLGVAEVTHLVATTVPGIADDDADRLARRIVADTRGNLLLALSMLAGVVGGAALGDGGAWPHPDRTLDQTRPGELPPAATGAVRVAFWRIPDGQREALLAAAALGERFTAAEVHRALAREVTTDLDWLEWHRWIVGGGGGYVFRTRLIREILREEMLPVGQGERYRALAGSGGVPGGNPPPGTTPQ